MKRHPRTIEEAVEYLKRTVPAGTLDLIRGAGPFDPVDYHFGLGMWVRDQLGLWKEGSELLRACNVTHPDEACGIILEALWENLVRTASAAELDRCRAVRRDYDAKWERAEAQAYTEFMEAEAAQDAAITRLGCPFCGKPCPSYRLTCKHCGKKVRERR